MFWSILSPLVCCIVITAVSITFYNANICLWWFISILTWDDFSMKDAKWWLMLVFLSVSIILPMLPSLLPWPEKRWRRGVPAPPMLWLRVWICDLCTDWLLLQLCLLLVDDLLECSGMELQDGVVNIGGLWLFVGLCGSVWSGVCRDGWNMGQGVDQGSLPYRHGWTIYSELESILRKQIVNQKHLWIFLELGYGSHALQYFTFVSFQDKLPTCCLPTPHWYKSHTWGWGCYSQGRTWGGGFYCFNICSWYHFHNQYHLHCRENDYVNTVSG